MKKLFYILFISLFIFSCDSDPVSPVDECGIVNGDNLNDEGYHCGDLDVIEDFINLTNYSGDILSFGNQNWTNGRLEGLDLSDNWSGGQNITGQIPESIGNLTSLTNILVRNQSGFNDDLRFHGIIPESICDIDNLEYLIICISWGSGCSGLFDFNSRFTYNNFCPPYPSCLNTPQHIGNQNTDNCQDFDCNNNEVKLGNYCLNIEETTEVNFSNTGIEGEIPSEIGELVNLTGLYLGGNQLTGEVPSEMWSFSNLYEYNLGDNQLSGIINEDICNLSNHMYISGYDPRTGQPYYNLSLTGNNFCPPYPECIEDYVGEQDTSNCP